MDKYMTTGISKEHPQDFTKISQASVIADNDRNLLTKSAAILNRWTKYCNNLCNYFNWSPVTSKRSEYLVGKTYCPLVQSGQRWGLICALAVLVPF
ncbi:hypothetical protein DPMN_002186 [Dreissena polymorpha]|uniref:Uncharacterized protein n=1 Tax=Dreissena polymorpha TaxID=45954 RepID=A0A9D4MJP4_DREPO|nr:hypothetical protein DPMN_002186 [Dreissena polymorpha]